MKKILINIKKIFFPEIEKYENCIYCGNKLRGSQRKFCSIACSNRYYSQLYSKGKKKDICYKPISKEEKELIQKKFKARTIAYKLYPSLKGIKCEVCGEKAEHRHHEDYDKPDKVNFVCWYCHGQIHAGFIDLNLHQNGKRLENKNSETEGGK